MKLTPYPLWLRAVCLAALFVAAAYWHWRDELAALVNWELRHLNIAAFAVMMMFSMWLLRIMSRYLD